MKGFGAIILIVFADRSGHRSGHFTTECIRHGGEGSGRTVCTPRDDHPLIRFWCLVSCRYPLMKLYWMMDARMVNNKLVLSLMWFQASTGSPGLVLLSLAVMCSHASCSMVMPPLDWSHFPPLSRVWCDFHNIARMTGSVYLHRNIFSSVSLLYCSTGT